MNPKVVAERLGHSSVSFTLDTYAHVMPGMRAEAAERFSDLVFGGSNGDETDQTHDDEDGGSDEHPETGSEEDA